jgi:transposase
MTEGAGPGHPARWTAYDGDIRHMGRRRGGLTTKTRAVVDRRGLTVRLALPPGQTHDSVLACELLAALPPVGMVLADRAGDADSVRRPVANQYAFANIPPERNRKFSPLLYRAHGLVYRFFNKLKRFRRVATRYDKLAAGRFWLRAYQSPT